MLRELLYGLLREILGVWTLAQVLGFVALGVILGLNWDNGRENGNHYLGFGDLGLRLGLYFESFEGVQSTKFSAFIAYGCLGV